MQICMLLTESFPPDIRVAKEGRALVEAGHDVVVLSPPVENRPVQEWVDGIEVIRLPFSEAHAGLGRLDNRVRHLVTQVHEGWTYVIDRLVAARDIDALHAHDLPIVATALAAGEKHDVPVVADLHENWPEAIRQYRRTDDLRDRLRPKSVAERLVKPIRLLKRLERRAVRGADKVITVVEEAREHYVRDCGADPSKVSVVSNVVDLESFDAMDGTPVPGYGDEFVLTYLGSLSGGHRGIDSLVRAMPAVDRRVPNAKLLVVGSGGTYAEQLRDLASRLGVDHCVEFTGRVPFEEVPAYLAASDVCSVPHRSTPHTETTVPHKLFQYMAARRAVLVTDVGPLGRVVRETDAGEVVPPDDPDAVAAAAAALYEDPDKCRSLGENGRAAVERRYNWAVESKALLAAYDELAAA